MDSEFKKWHTRIIEELAKGTPSFPELYQILLEMKGKGVKKEFAYALFKDIRSAENNRLTESVDNMLLEIMDIISGYCSPQLIIWE